MNNFVDIRCIVYCFIKSGFQFLENKNQFKKYYRKQKEKKILRSVQYVTIYLYIIGTNAHIIYKNAYSKYLDRYFSDHIIVLFL